MSLAMKYNMKKRMAKGGASCEACKGGECMEHGGEVKSHLENGSEEHSSGHSREEAIKKAKELRDQGIHGSIHHGEGPKSGPKSKYSVRVPQSHKMADGGDVEPKPSPTVSPERKKAADAMRSSFNDPQSASGAWDKIKQGFMEGSGTAMAQPKAEGGEMHDDDLVMKIMKKRYSQGGQVANDVGTGQEADKLPNQFDDLVLDDDLEFHETGANSGDELGDEAEDEDRRDIVKKIMKSRAKKDRMPRPA